MPEREEATEQLLGHGAWPCQSLAFRLVTPKSHESILLLSYYFKLFIVAAPQNSYSGACRCYLRMQVELILTN